MVWYTSWQSAYQKDGTADRGLNCVLERLSDRLFGIWTGKLGGTDAIRRNGMSVRYAIRSIVVFRKGHTERQRGYQKDGMCDRCLMDGFSVCKNGYLLTLLVETWVWCVLRFQSNGLNW